MAGLAAGNPRGNTCQHVPLIGPFRMLYENGYYPLRLLSGWENVKGNGKRHNMEYAAMPYQRLGTEHIVHRVSKDDKCFNSPRLPRASIAFNQVTPINGTSPHIIYHKVLHP
jgi:hypothetical protein